MPIQWSGLGPELLVSLQRNDDRPLRAQLEQALRDAIRSGRLPGGERLPSSRELARELSVSRGLVQECYAQLLAEGFLIARTGSGTRVAPSARQDAVATPAPPPVQPRPRIDFRPGTPDVGSFPRRDWLWALREAARTAPADTFRYGDPRGSLRLRELLAGYLRRVRGAVPDPERIVICAGFAQGYALVLQAMAHQRPRRIAVEDPGHADNRQAVTRAGHEAVSVAVDEHGIDVAALEASGAEGVMLTPAHQSPSGVVLAPQRRQALIDWATERDAVIIEDDYDSEFRYDRDPVGALQGLAPSRVAMIGTVSKSLSPALRLGWVLAPAELHEAVADEKYWADHGSPMLDQLALATLIESGRFDRHLRRMRGVYAGRRRALIEALAEHAPEVELRGLAAGIHAVACLRPGHEELEIVDRARERSVGLFPMSRYRANGATKPPQLVLGFGNVTEPAIRRGIETIADLISG